MRPRGGHEAADRVHERRLAGAVGADEPDELVGVHVDADVVDGLVSAEAHD